MKSIVIYYSFEGNTKLIANSVCDTLGADLLRLQLAKELKTKSFIKYFWGGKEVFIKKTPELLPYYFDVDAYDLILIGTPVWAWNFAPAVKTFLTKEKIKNKKIALFCCHGGGKGKIFTRLKTALEGNEFVGEIDFRDPLRVKTELNLKRAKEWAKEIISNSEA
jgi:flavodoxin